MVGPPLHPAGHRPLARWRTLAVGVTGATLLIAVALAWLIAPRAVRSQGHVHAGGSVRSRGTPGFGDPVAIADDGTHLWVANLGTGDNPSVTELNASNGGWVQTMSGGEDQFGGPNAIASDGAHVLVAGNTGVLTELTISSGAWAQLTDGGYVGSDPVQYVIAMGGGYSWVAAEAGRGELSKRDGSGRVRPLRFRGSFDVPSAILVVGQHVWVASLYSGRGGSSALTELNAGDGSVVRTVSGGIWVNPVAIGLSGGDIWVADQSGGSGHRGSLTELDATDGRRVRAVSGSAHRIDYPVAMAVYGGDIWVLNSGSGNRDGSVTELSASDGHWIRTLSGARYGFDDPTAIAVDHAHVWVVNVAGNSITELNASDGSWVQTLYGRPMPVA